MISKEEVLNLAALARLKVSDQEVESLQKDISNILEYVGQISAVSISGGDTPEVPLNHNILREDVVRGARRPDGREGRKYPQGIPAARRGLFGGAEDFAKR